MPEPDPIQLAAIQAVLSAVPRDMLVARAMTVLEDAFMACAFGLQFGLTLEAVQRSVVELLTDQLPPAR